MYYSDLRSVTSDILQPCPFISFPGFCQSPLVLLHVSTKAVEGQERQESSEIRTGTGIEPKGIKGFRQY